MAKFFNENSDNNQENRFFSNQNMVNEEVEEDTPSFVSAADAAMMAQQVETEPEEEEEEVYYQPTDSNEFASDDQGMNDFQPASNMVSASDSIETLTPDTLDEPSAFEEETLDDEDNQDPNQAFNNYQEQYVNDEEFQEHEILDNSGVEYTPDDSFEQSQPDENAMNEMQMYQEESNNVSNQSEFVDNNVNNQNQMVQNSYGMDNLNNIQEYNPAPFQEPVVNNSDNQNAFVNEPANDFSSNDAPNISEVEIDTGINEENSTEDVNIENSSMFANVETSYVVDNTYKGVDNTGKTGTDIKNPVYLDAFEKNDVNVSGNILAVLLVLFEVLLSPGKSIIKNTQKYVNGKKAYKVFLNIVIYEFIFSLIGHIIGGCFVDKMRYGEFRKVLDYSNVLKLNYLNILISTVVVIFGLVLLITLFNYASSFFSNKGLSFDSYLLITSLSFFPLVLTINTFVPMLNVMSIYLSIGLIIIASLFSIMIYLNSLWNIMEFKSENGKIFYSLMTFILVTIVVVIIILIFFEDYVNAIKMVFK